MQRVKMRLTKSQYCFLFHICLVDWMAQFFFSSFFCVYYLRRKKCMKQFSIKCWFALLCSVIGPEILSLSLSLSLNQSDAKLAPITTWSPVFSRVLGGLLGFLHEMKRQEVLLLPMGWDASPS